MVVVLYLLALCSFAVLGLFVVGLTVHTRLVELRRAVERAAPAAGPAVDGPMPASPGAESPLEAARGEYERAVAEYNAACASLPGRVVAALTGLRPWGAAEAAAGRRR